MMFDVNAHEFIAIDWSRIDSYKGKIVKNSSFFTEQNWSLVFNLGIVRTQTTIDPKKNANRKPEIEINKFISKLINNEILDCSRPGEDGIYLNYSKPFILEKEIQATKMLLPVNSPEVPELKYLVIWVSMPKVPELCDISEERFVRNEGNKLPPVMERQGTVLFLIESFWEDDQCSRMMSGCSALEWIARNAINDDPKFWSSQGTDYSHPVQKLKHLGAIDQGKRNISTLYRKRYVSDEQLFVVGTNQTHHSSDIIGYPLFVAIPFA